MKSTSWFTRVALVSAVALLCSAAVGREDQAPPSPQQAGLLYADLWVQTSGEYVACCLQTYRLAGDEVEREIARSREEERLARDFRGLPPAVVMDLDETVLDNGTYQSYLYLTGKTHSTDLFCQFVTENRSSIRLVPGAKDFIEGVESLGVPVVYITNRPDELRDVTIATLAQWGINTKGLEDPANLRLLLETGSESSKTPRRDLVRAKYRIIALVGDQLGDFADEFSPIKDNTYRARIESVYEYKSMWGRRWFILPNSVYGQWQGVLRGDPVQYLRRAEK
jgi:5'-nucleotidase (lipoprotein e(P4) family)